MTLNLLIVNKNYSSWSMRPWLVLTQFRLPFEETVVPLFVDGFKDRLMEWSPVGMVPVLRDGDIVIWESLSIMEYLVEKFPDQALWPEAAGARALARSVSSEMHAGFAAMRGEMPMNIRRRKTGFSPSPEARGNIDRIDELWRQCLDASGGPFLFGEFTIADAMYAPVVSRFVTYDIQGLSPPALGYMQDIQALPAYREWVLDSEQEDWIIDKYED